MKRFRQATGLMVLVMLLLSTRITSALYYHEPTPKGIVGLSRPPIQQQIFLDAGESIKAVRMWLDGNRVEATWDSTGRVRYVPPAPLAPGTHAVRLIVEVSPASTKYVYDPLVSDFTFTVASGAIELPPLPGPEAQRALEAVNAYRKAATAGLQPMTYNTALGAAAGAHASYLAAHPGQTDANAHGETPGTALFTGASPLARAQYFSYGDATSEVINFTDRAEDAVAGWMETLYHRIPLIHPGYRELGYGLAGGGDGLVNVLDAGPGDDVPGVVLWPYSDQTGVPTGWDGGESPDPLRLYPGTTGPVGYTITATFGGSVRSLTLDAWSLTGPEGSVPAMQFSPRNDEHLMDTVALIPYAPLTPGGRYTVTLKGAVDTGAGPQSYTKTWSFTTDVSSEPLLNRMTISTRSGVLSQVTVEGSGFGLGTNAYLGGLPVRDLSVTAGRLTFTSPMGLTAGTHDLLVVSRSGREAAWSDFLKDGVALPDTGDPFWRAPVYVHGVKLASPALVHDEGPVLLPEQALVELGATGTKVTEINRSYWSWAGRLGDYTIGRVASNVGGDGFTLTLPVQQIGGQTFIEREFLSRLTLDSLAIHDNRIDVGMRDIGGHWARPQIIQLLHDGIVSGAGAGQFQPNGTLTRAAFVKMLVNARRLSTLPGDAGTFSDTAQHWVAAQGYIGAAVKGGIVVPSEYPGARFLPEQAITREEMAVMITRALGLDAQARAKQVPVVGGIAAVGGHSFTDALSWTRSGYVAMAMEQGIITGYQEEGTANYTFRPTRQATRAEAVVMIVRTLDK